MTAGFLLYDVLFLSVATALYGGAALVAVRAAEVLAAYVPWPVAAFPALLSFILVLIAEVAVLTAALPTLRPGKYPAMRGPVFITWILRSMLRRVLFLPGLKWLIFSSNVLRLLALRALGARVAFTAGMSTDVEILDPALLVVAPGAMIGARSLVAGHWIAGGNLVLGEVRVEAGALIAADVIVAPGVTVGPRAQVKARVALGPGVTVGEGADVGGGSVVDAGARIGARAVLDTAAYVPPRGEVPDDGRVATALRA